MVIPIKETIAEDLSPDIITEEDLRRREHHPLHLHKYVVS
jgi:hypothetical protein